MSELRQDLVSGDWIIMAPERGGRPHNIGGPPSAGHGLSSARRGKKSSRKPSPKKSCPFENPEKTGNWPPILSWPNIGKNPDAQVGRGSDRKRRSWQILLIPNKYPALTHNSTCAVDFKKGPYNLKTGEGKHDLLITRDHRKNFGDLALDKATKVLEVLQERYRMLHRDKCLMYTSAFFNWGASAGASIYHPHYQVISLPILPSDFKHSLLGLESYYKKHHRCAHCVMLAEALKSKTRIVDGNKSAILVSPFVPRESYEIRVFPKRHLSRFEDISVRELRDMAAMLQSGIRRIKRYLGDPDFNFFIHTAPLKDDARYRCYHWHIEIIPKISILGGFELSTGVDITVVDPEKAAAVLRGRK
jgi:UDPglucose--hexose-1-phosphate uridylyltransferase